MKIENYYEDPQILHLGTQENRAYYLPYQNEKGDRTIMLSSDTWKFMWYKNIRQVPNDFIHGQCDDFDTIPVPSCVNILGYEPHQYANVLMPIPFDPPYVPSENPCGAYFRTFEISDLSEDYMLNFEGVDSCFYLWINGTFVGYSQVSHSTSEFDIGKYLVLGENKIAVLVLKWCDGTYFEDQDKLRMSGIFRDVYILRRAKKRIVDYTIKTTIKDAGKIDVKIKSECIEKLTAVLLDPSNKEVFSGEVGLNFEINVKNPLCWNGETPYLYTLILKTSNETIEQKVGIKQLEIKNSIIYLNGKVIKLKGTNRHDSDAKTGYTISREQLTTDLKMMKEHNINAIRTSHYPNAPWAYELYSQYGFYIIDESDIETHNTDALFGNEITGRTYENQIIADKYFGLLCSDPTYEKTILDRVQRCVERDKNQPCVIMWSLGNESGFGVNMEKAAKWIKEQDSDYIVHYESSIYQIPGHINDLSNIDVYSRMYMDHVNCDKYCENEPKKPLVLCEFIACLGNGPGDCEDYFDVIYKHDEFSGAFIWEWNDHAIYYGKTIDGKDKYYYGGDFGDFPNEKNFCVDGMITPERTPHTGLLEYKNVARPIRASFSDGKIELFNTMDFTNVKDKFNIEWSLVVDNKIVENATIDDFDLAPHETKEIQIPYNKNLVNSDLCYLFLNYTTKTDDCLFESGTDLGFDQIILNKGENEIIKPQVASKINVKEDDDTIIVIGNNFNYQFKKYEAAISSMIYQNKEFLFKPMQYNVWRAPIDNDKRSLASWTRLGYDRMCVKVYSFNAEKYDDKVQITFDLSFAAQFMQRFADVTSTWTIFNDGQIQLDLNIKKNMDLPYFPRLGIRMFLPKDFQNVEYRGYGPYESYLDKHHTCYYSDFKSDINKLHVDYLVPQENGSHCGCTKLNISSGLSELNIQGNDFSFNTSPYTQEELTTKTHNFELVKSDFTVLCLDCKMSGVGSTACGPLLLEKYQTNDELTQKTFIFNLK